MTISASEAQNIKVEIMEVSADTAKEWLYKNKVNRRVREGKVDQYYRDMVEGRWNFCPDAITFDVSGNLINGQHRMGAQIRAGLTMHWVVVTDAPENTQNTMDSGVMRSAADTLHLAGEQNAQLMAAIARIVHLIKNETLTSGRYTISGQQILDTVRENTSIRRSTEMASQSKAGMTPIAPSVLGSAHWMIQDVNGPAEADQFILRLINLTDEREGSPVLALSRRINELKRNRQRVHSRDLLAMVIKTWNYDVDGKITTRISVGTKSGVYEHPVAAKRERAFSLDEDSQESA